jgi:uncharacterized membrane protein YuzA (DUF378 family)
MIDQEILHIITQVLLIAGAINWGAVAFNGSDLVRMAVGSGQAEKIVKFTVAAAGGYALWALIDKMMKKEQYR